MIQKPEYIGDGTKEAMLIGGMLMKSWGGKMADIGSFLTAVSEDREWHGAERALADLEKLISDLQEVKETIEANMEEDAQGGRMNEAV